MADKPRLRQKMRQLRAEKGRPVAAQAAQALIETAREAGLLMAGGSVMAGYWPVGDEIDPRPLMQACHEAGHVLCLPVTGGAEEALHFRRYTPGDRLAPDMAGVKAPLADAPVLRPEIILLPLLAFDADGVRLGQGGGHYDRTLAALSAQATLRAIGLAFDFQQLDKCPRAPHDQVLNDVLTQSRHFACGATGQGSVE